MSDYIFLQPLDFGCVGLITKSCDISKLCIAVNESREFDMEPIFCYDFFEEVLTKWENLPESDLSEEEQNYKDLIYGSTYLSNGKTKKHLGIKKLWTYYAYAKYVIINAHNDSPNGLTTKQNDWSMPVPLKEINTISARYSNMAKETIANIKEYLCLNKEKFSKFDDCECRLQCGCTGACNCDGKPKRVSGFKFRSVSR